MQLDELSHPHLREWINQAVERFNPKSVYICDGSDEENQRLSQELVDQGVFIALDEKKRPHSFWSASDPRDVARVEERTFICSHSPDDAGPTNHHVDPETMKKSLDRLMKGCMQGRTMYVIPFCMGPLDADLAMIGVQLTDSAYVVCNMRIMTRMGKPVLDRLKASHPFIPCIHSVGVPLKEGDKDSPWPCRPDETVIAHFPEEKLIVSFGSGYGGNALLGKKCVALRIASVKAKEEKWLAEHMLVIKVTNPEGKVKYMSGSFPSACGKTNLAMLKPTIPGWKVECVGDDIAWMNIGEDGRLHAINPEAGIFGVAPGTSDQSNPHCMTTIRKNTIFTNVALTEDGDVWWEGKSSLPPKMKMNWLRHAWKPGDEEKAAHPNSRFTAPISQCPILAKEFDSPKGVPIDAIIFGGRRKSVIPLIYEAPSWEGGVFAAASLSSEMTAAVKGEMGRLRHDPFSMLAFCGYHMGDYFQHWLNFTTFTQREALPRIFNVNWFRQNEKGEYLWPGFGENSRMIKWIFERCDQKCGAQETAIGYLPHLKDIDIEGLNMSCDTLEELLYLDPHLWKKEIQELQDYFKIFDPKFPKQLSQYLVKLLQKIEDSL
ncbi:MAG: phosphoenolpyruvate carboxykinase (GTP) [Simkaniaceae bacterium]|nr:phosphoenolpyruvate carboxykinase (GTP) [Simkaniaceae bacterium]